MAIDVTARSAVEGDERRAPVASDGSLSDDICGNSVSREKPDVDTGGLPLHCIHSSANIVESVTVCCAIVGLNSAAVVTVVGVTV